ncbi:MULTISPECIES: hypothetical protein [unclassified Sulfuricurvum]|uniref:hypothetical protein n=1 Tax=unclassified Sulfuricurvum TaxID=2632390 RepID=UPI0002995CF9|nr:MULTISPECIES: hypothetical protein [unclassified Sulfuricurvum]AFV97423.1 hypothetical protein B649_05545 [Candidatus Sulfuricurvum sp. RIFRC-1]HBM35118.1 hypothetical protein [Sulfuricurvum sp.]
MISKKQSNEEPIFSIKDEMFWMDRVYIFIPMLSIIFYILWIGYDFNLSEFLKDKNIKIMLLIIGVATLFGILKILFYSAKNTKIEFYSDRIVSTYYNRTLYLNQIDEAVRVATLFSSPKSQKVNRIYGAKLFGVLIIFFGLPLLFPAILLSSQMVHWIYRLLHHETLTLLSFHYAYMSIIDHENNHIVIMLDTENDKNINEYMQSNYGIRIEELPQNMWFVSKKNSNLKMK